MSIVARVWGIDGTNPYRLMMSYSLATIAANIETHLVCPNIRYMNGRRWPNLLDGTFRYFKDQKREEDWLTIPHALRACGIDCKNIVAIVVARDRARGYQSRAASIRTGKDMMHILVERAAATPFDEFDEFPAGITTRGTRCVDPSIAIGMV